MYLRFALGSLLLIACNTEPQPPKTTLPPVKEAPKVDPDAQCAHIVDAGWRVAKVALTELGVTDTTAIEARHRKASKAFFSQCKALPADKRACLTATDDPVTGLDTCKINQGVGPAHRIFPTPALRYAELLKPQPLPKASGEQLLASLAGTWSNHLTQNKSATTWTITPHGEVRGTTARAGQEKTDTFNIRFELVDRLTIARGKSTQNFIFAHPSPNTFYASGNLAYGAFRLRDPKNFIVGNEADIVRVKDGVCTVFSDSGTQTTPTTCGFTERNGVEVFEIVYQFKDQLDARGRPLIKRQSLHRVGPHLLDRRLIESSKFTRQR